MTAAAEVLHLTPSAVSQQLAALESEVGQELLERRGRRVAITSAGRLLLEHADTILIEVERAEEAMRRHAEGSTGEIRVAAFSTAISLLVAPSLVSLRASTPGLRLVVRDVEGHQGITQLLDGEVELAIAVEHRGTPRADDERLTRIPLYAEPFVAVIPSTHPAADAQSVDLTALSADDWVMTSIGNPLRDVVLLACEQAGFQPRIVHTSDDFHSVAALVAANAGVSLIPRLAVPTPSPAVIRPLTDPPPVRRVFAATRRGQADNPLIAATLKTLAETAADLPLTS
ncbi:DNA-binding transcriptional LysR family regulator [Kribbella orskensis]|uniref:DNA-binding transcriptional LysR family regulator n=1 Tax=Kribbella orskensis TaxID=2512216 RepID=A0ABY2BG18_9ACTN|nr:DNA-binding transcriptional LysR family regulator [Kribbella sp. VKM Ac-2500]TCO18431.1 DNA-binding transcriptional LysR family regulator [Kribbella orskensis]